MDWLYEDNKHLKFIVNLLGVLGFIMSSSSQM